MMQNDAPTQHATDTRARILDAALSAFCAKGFHATTTREIASAVGMSPAGVYVYFDSKQALLSEIVESSHAELLEELEQVDADTAQGSARLHDLVKTFSAFNATHVRYALVIERELSSLDEETFGRVREQRQVIIRLLTEAIEGGIASGEFQVATNEIHDLVLGLAALSIDLARWYHIDGPMSPDELGALHGRWALRMVKARDEQGDVQT